MSNYLKNSFLACILVFILTSAVIGQEFSKSVSKYAVIAYYMGRGNDAAEYPVEKLTHIIYSFLHLEGNKLMDKSHDSINITELVALKQRNPSLKVILSLGGWGGCPTCPDVFATETGRLEFALSVKHLLEKYQADGLDLDWEYPAIASIPGYKFTPEDKPNFTALILKLRDVMGADYELSFAAGGFKQFLDESIEWSKVMPHLNYVNLMTYDIINGYSTKSGHHTSLYSTPEQINSTDYIIKYLDSLGVPRNKMIIGAAFYARVFKDAAAVNNGLYQECKFSDYVNFKSFDTYFDQHSGFDHFWDPIAMAPYSYNADKKLFATYDNKRSIELKTRYVKENTLGGIMFWSLGGDTYSEGLLDTIYKTLLSE
jgi:chitinase